MRTYFFGALLLGAFLGSIMTSRAAELPTELTGCLKNGDCLHAYEALGRRLWASRCFPEYQREIETHALWMDETETPRAAYPTFTSTEDREENASIWFAPTDPEASCDLPSGYRLSGYLFRERATRLPFDPRG